MLFTCEVKRMKSKILLFVMVILLTSGCVRVDLGETMPTIGEQILDLTDAYENGVISEDEFKRLRRKVLRNFLN